MYIHKNLLFLVFFVSACFLLNLKLYGNFDPSNLFSNINAADTLKILPLGNSITFDKRSNDIRDDASKAGYRQYLFDSLSTHNFLFDFIGSEKSGWNKLLPGFEDNAGFPGIKDDQLLNLLETGWRVQPPDYNYQITSGPYLETYTPDIILLHIGTNGNDEINGTKVDDIAGILDEVDRVEILFNKEIKVIVAKIIDRVPNEIYVDELNVRIDSLVNDRKSNPANPAYPDNIEIVDMQVGSNIIYEIDSLGTIGDGIIGDMNDHLHPNDKGHLKLANQWFSVIKTLYPTTLNIIQQPNDIYAVAGMTAQLNVSITSSDSVSYQWEKNGEIIPGANQEILSIGPLEVSDNLSKYVCRITSRFHQVLTDTATVYVAGDSARATAGLVAEYLFDGINNNKINNTVLKYSNLDLDIGNPGNVEFVPFGLKINNTPDIKTSTPAKDLYNAIYGNNEITLELWLSPSNITQSGPARILTLSENSSFRNFTVGQDADIYKVRLRTTTTSLNGKPSTSTDINSVTPELSHLVFVRKDSINQIYINGQLNNSEIIYGDFSNWDSTYTLAIGDEIDGNRLWQGIIYLVGIYDRALTYDEIVHNYDVKFNGFDYLLIPPDNLTATISEGTNVTLEWSDNSQNELGFIIERKANKADSIFAIIDSVSADVTIYKDSTRKFDSSYVYRIKSYNEFSYSNYSNEFIVSEIPVSVEKSFFVKQEYELFQNYPNPFNPTTNISFVIPINSEVSLEVYNSLGERVKIFLNNVKLQKGFYNFNFDGGNLTSGIYFYRIIAESRELGKKFVSTKKAILVK